MVFLLKMPTKQKRCASRIHDLFWNRHFWLLNALLMCYYHHCCDNYIYGAFRLRWYADSVSIVRLNEKQYSKSTESIEQICTMWNGSRSFSNRVISLECKRKKKNRSINELHVQCFPWYLDELYAKQEKPIIYLPFLRVDDAFLHWLHVWRGPCRLFLEVLWFIFFCFGSSRNEKKSGTENWHGELWVFEGNKIKFATAKCDGNSWTIAVA